VQDKGGFVGNASGHGSIRIEQPYAEDAKKPENN
jgi:hypothetical protein